MKMIAGAIFLTAGAWLVIGGVRAREGNWIIVAGLILGAVGVLIAAVGMSATKDS